MSGLDISPPAVNWFGCTEFANANINVHPIQFFPGAKHIGLVIHGGSNYRTMDCDQALPCSADRSSRVMGKLPVTVVRHVDEAPGYNHSSTSSIFILRPH